MPINNRFLACDRCQKRKKKCDRKFPKCSACERAGDECVQKDVLTNRLLPRDYTVRLEHELARAHEIIQNQNLTLQKARDTDVTDERRPNRDYTLGPLLKLSSTFESGVNADITLPHANRDNVLMYANYYMSPINKSLEQEMSKPDLGQDLKSPPIVGWPVNKGLSKEVLLTYMDRLPSNQVCNYLLKIYFDNEYPIFPVLNQVETYANFFQISEAKMAFRSNKETPVQEETLFHSFVNIYFANLVFALAASNLESAHSKKYALEHPEYNRDLYRRSARELGGFVFERLDVLVKLQAMILMGQIALCRPCFPGLWNISSLVASIAVKFALFDESTLVGKGDDPARTEMKRRCFWCAYMMDRYTGLCVAKPHMIDEFSITAQYFSPVEDESLMETNPRSSVPSVKKYSLFYIEFFRTMSEIHALLYSSYPERLLAEHSETYFRDQKIALRQKLDNTQLKVEQFDAGFQGRGNFYIGYLTLLYYQALCLLYKPNRQFSDPAADDYEHLYDATGHIIELFKSMSDKRLLTYRILSVSSLFFASIMYNYCVWKCDKIAEKADIETIQQHCNDSKIVFQQIDDFYNEDTEHKRRIDGIVTACSSMLSKFAGAAIDHVGVLAKREQKEKTPELKEPTPETAFSMDDTRLFGSAFDPDCPFDMVTSLDNIQWDLNIE